MERKNNYVIWAAYFDPTRNFCVLDDLENVKRDFQLKKGIPRLHDFSADARFSMDQEYPKDIELADNLFNIKRLIVASKRLSEFIQNQSSINIEFLPVTILNHKEHVASKDYFIVHPIYPQDCLDVQGSGCTWSTIITDEIDEVKKLVIDESRLDQNIILFRLKYFYKLVLVRRDIAGAITAEGFTGLRWIELDEYPER